MLEQVTVVIPPELWNESNRGRLSAHLAAEFPSVFIAFDGDEGPAHLRASEWERPDFDTWTFDCSVDELSSAPFTLRILDDRGDRPHFPLQVLNRCQRLIGRRNRHSHGQLFDRVLRRHRRLHDTSRPLVRADYNHSLDVWQWVLRLAPEASLAVQLAALFHDVERLASEADARVEHLAADYQQFKDAHAAAGAEITRNVLAETGVGETVCARVAEIVANHERPSNEDAEVTLLNDADALSFFSLNANGYAAYFGPEQTRKKVAYTLRRLSPRAKPRLAYIHLPADVREMLQ